MRQKRYRRIQRREEQGFSRQWFLLCGQAGKEWLLNPQPKSLRKLPADPMIASGRTPSFGSAATSGSSFAKSGSMTSRTGTSPSWKFHRQAKPLSPAKPVLVKDHHLSYPFLFEHEGALYMVPEGGQGRTIDVYQCEEFPDRWRKRATLKRNLRYADATLLEYQAKWWLFVTIKRGVFALSRDLFIFWADTPLTDQWHAHPANPVVRGLKYARPAGRLFELGGRLFRPSQECLVRYGHSLRINEVLRLDAKRYQERLATTVRPDWEDSICANHHIDWKDGVVVMDAQRLFPTPSSP